MLCRAPRSAINFSLRIPVSNTALGLTMLAWMPSVVHCGAATAFRLERGERTGWWAGVDSSMKL